MRPNFKRISALTICLLISLAGLPKASAVTTVTLNAGLGLPGLVDSSGVFVTDGNQVQVGFFNAGFDVLANASDLAALTGAWNLFGFRNVSTVLGVAGRAVGDVSNTDASFDNQKIFWWAFGGGGEYGIFSSTSSNWLFPVEGAVLSSTVTSSNEVDEFFHSNLSINGDLQLQPPPPVPDATTTLWLLLGSFFGIAGFRRILTKQV